MNTPRSQTSDDYSRATPAGRERGGLPSGLLRALLGLAAIAGAIALVVATATTLIEIRVGTVRSIAGHQTTFSGWDRHSVALLLIAAVALPMAGGALRGSRPAAVALALCGVATLVIALAIDLPDLSSSGEVGLYYDQASARAGAGYYAETLGAVLMLLAGGGLLALGWGSPQRPPAAEPAENPTPSARR